MSITIISLTVVVALIGIGVLELTRRNRRFQTQSNSRLHNLHLRYCNGELDHSEYDEELHRLGACKDE